MKMYVVNVTVKNDVEEVDGINYCYIEKGKYIKYGWEIEYFEIRYD